MDELLIEPKFIELTNGKDEDALANLQRIEKDMILINEIMVMLNDMTQKEQMALDTLQENVHETISHIDNINENLDQAVVQKTLFEQHRLKLAAIGLIAFNTPIAICFGLKLGLASVITTGSAYVISNTFKTHPKN
jgi:t-SNARE complex subunit (syntaxin)